MKMLQNRLTILIAAFALLDFAACSGNGHGTDVDSGTDAGTDTDSDADSGGDSGSDTDTDTDTEPVIVESCMNGWCEIPSGVFIYGSPSTEPCQSPYAEQQLEVVLTRSFIIQQTEVTQAQWEAAGFPNPVKNVIAPDVPVNLVNYFEAMAYANFLSTAEGLDTCYDLSDCIGTVGSGCPDGAFFEHGCWNVASGDPTILPQIFRCESDVHKYADWYACPGYRLPTDAEWEYAARAGATGSTWVGEITTGMYEGENGCNDPVADEVMWYCGNADTVQPVAGKYKNGWGLYDALGNIKEWTDYVYKGLPLDTTVGQGEPVIDPLGDGVGTVRVLRGGSYRDVACFSRLGTQIDESVEVRGDMYGIRLVRTLSDDMSEGRCVWP
jgi:formylglycine-generating enzyme required for sulfatase activity